MPEFLIKGAAGRLLLVRCRGSVKPLARCPACDQGSYTSAAVASSVFVASVSPSAGSDGRRWVTFQHGFLIFSSQLASVIMHLFLEF